MIVIKRDGSEQVFDKHKIEVAVNKACKQTSTEQSGNIVANQLETLYTSLNLDKIDIKKIEEDVFLQLSNIDPLSARAYESYRAIREDQRNKKAMDNEIYALLDKTSYTSTENSNKDGSLNSTIGDFMAGVISKDMVRRNMFSTEVIRAHDSGEVHIHDMDYDVRHMFNCCLVDLKDMFENGMAINKVLIETPKSFQTACTVATQVVQQIANGQYGGQTISVAHLAPYLRLSYSKHYDNELNKIMSNNIIFAGNLKDVVHKLAWQETKKELKAGIQTIQYQINTFSSSNGQAPFLSIYIDVEEDEEFAKEISWIAEEIFIQRIQGVKNEAGYWTTPAFPKLLYVLNESNIHDDSEYRWLTDLAEECTIKRMNPDFISKKKMIEDYGDCFPCMGCRSFLLPYKDSKRDYKWYGRFNQGVVTLNLVDIALTVGNNKQTFFDLLDERMLIAKEALMAKHNKLIGVKSDVSPIHWQYGGIARLDKGEVIDKYLYNDYSTLAMGYMGLDETVKVLGTGGIHTKKGNLLAQEILRYINDTLKEWRIEENIGWTLYGTPAESTTDKFSKKLKEKFGNIEGITDKGYITNSYHVEVTQEIDAFEKLKVEAPLQSLTTGGSVSYIEATNLNYNKKVISDLVKFMYDNIRYAEINTKNDQCLNCGYEGELKFDTEWYCPKCENRNKNYLLVIRRTCGYIGNNFHNEGRTKEILSRIEHLDNKEG